MKLEKATEVFKALGDKTRLRLLKLLADFDREICVCELDDAVELPQYSVSKHLNVLKKAGLLEGCREGTWVYYSLSNNMTPLTQEVVDSVDKFLGEKIIVQDKERLRKRLTLREEGKCVVGYADEKGANK